MEDFKQCEIKIVYPSEAGKDWYNDKSLSGTEAVARLIEKLNECFKNEQQNFCYICYYLFELKKKFDSYDLSYYQRYFDSAGNFVFYETVCKAFGLEEKQVQRYLKIYERFMILTDDVVPKLKDEFFGYSKSKLIELLPLSDSEIKKVFKLKKIKPDSTCKEIRNYVKSVKGGEKEENKVLEDTSRQSDSEEQQEITDCGQYVVFKEENFNYIKTVLKGRKYNYNDTSTFINAVLDYCRDKELFL